MTALLDIVNGRLSIIIVEAGDIAQAFEKGLRAGDVFLLGFHQIGVKAAGFHVALECPAIKTGAQIPRATRLPMEWPPAPYSRLMVMILFISPLLRFAPKRGEFLVS